MVHLGDIKKIHDPPFVECITFGSPCQDLSIAGKRAGLSGERSGLFMEAVRIIKEMRCHSGGAYPTFAIWENVPGAFSSNSGKDFHAVLEELARIEAPEISIPRPKNGKWAKAGVVCGDGWSIAWRTFDAQFWGVPQRRRRIAVVVDFGGQRAGEILFEHTGVRRDSEPSIPPWQGVARNPAHRTAGHDRVVETAIPINTQIATRHISMGERTGMGWGKDGDPAYTLQAGHEHAVLCAAFTAGQGAKANGIAWAEEQAPTLRTDGGLSVYSENGSFPALAAREHAGQNQQTVLTKTTLRWIVRRLTPTECERLQGFPDGWTDIGERTDSKGKRHKPADSPRYKAMGNSIALPQWWWIVCKMAQYLPDRATLGSLFDGIGGFPLVWETLHGKGSAVWASEIEEFPIAVTKRRFPEEGEKSDEL